MKNIISNEIHGYNNTNQLQYTGRVIIYDRFVLRIIFVLQQSAKTARKQNTTKLIHSIFYKATTGEFFKFLLVTVSYFSVIFI